jgi:hypothetical protein
MRHIGIKPDGPLERVEDGRNRRTYIETLPDGGYRIWNDKLLKRGCNKVVYEDERDGVLVYCPWCDEWFSRRHYE